MITLYLNHFRGFEDTFIPLSDVSFLVGENSTGKTSVLTALRVLGDYSPWLLGRLQVGDEALGSFSDFASHQEGWFQLGYFRHDLTNGHNYDAALLTFKGSAAQVPWVIDVHLRGAAGDVRFREENGDIFYEKLAATVRLDEASFREWATSNLPSIAAGSRVLEIDEQSLRPMQAVAALTSQEMAAYEQRVDTLLQRTDAQVAAQAEWLKGVRSGGPLAPPPRIEPSSKPERPQQFPPTGMSWTDVVDWMAPIRAKPRRSYDAVAQPYSAEGDHIPWQLHSLSEHSKLRERLRAFGTGSGLYEDIEARRFGDAGDSPFELRAMLGKTTPSLINVGYGVSQALPIVMSIADPGRRRRWFAIQQPEVHLHPRAQAALGELFFDTALAPQHQRFLVETHSDYVVDRFRYRMRAASQKGEPVPSAQVLFFERAGDKNIVHRMVLGPDGRYPEDQPEAFRAFFLQEELRNLGY